MLASFSASSIIATDRRRAAARFIGGCPAGGTMDVSMRGESVIIDEPSDAPSLVFLLGEPIGCCAARTAAVRCLLAAVSIITVDEEETGCGASCDDGSGMPMCAR